MDIVGQLNAHMAEMVGGVVETVGEESEGILEQHEEEEEELTKVSKKLWTVFLLVSGAGCSKTDASVILK